MCFLWRARRRRKAKLLDEYLNTRCTASLRFGASFVLTIVNWIIRDIIILITAIRDGRMQVLQLSTTHTVSCHYVIFTDGAWAVT